MSRATTLFEVNVVTLCFTDCFYVLCMGLSSVVQLASWLPLFDWAYFFTDMLSGKPVYVLCCVVLCYVYVCVCVRVRVHWLCMIFGLFVYVLQVPSDSQCAFVLQQVTDSASGSCHRFQ